MVQGSLPWKGVYNRIAVYQEKESWTPNEFLDYARGLEYDEEPDYPRWREAFSSLANSTSAPTEHLFTHRIARPPPGSSYSSDPESDGEDNRDGKPSASRDDDCDPLWTSIAPEGVPKRHTFRDEDALIRENVPLMKQIPVMLLNELKNTDEKIVVTQ